VAFGRKRDDAGSVEDERDRLRLQRAELEDLKRELAERVAAVREREAELRAVIANGKGADGTAMPVPLLPTALGPDAGTLARRASELAAREEALAAREQALEEESEQAGTRITSAELEARATALDRRSTELEQREAELERKRLQSPAERDADRLAEIEARLAEVKEAEKAFLRTQQELATRSEAVAARERLVGQRERELDEREDGWGAPDLGDLETRLRRLETSQHGRSEQPGFSGGFRKLQQQGTRPRQEQ
jgi:hypothetical protein